MDASQVSPRGRCDPSPHAAVPNIMPCGGGGVYPEHLSVTTSISGAAQAPPPFKDLGTAAFATVKSRKMCTLPPGSATSGLRGKRSCSGRRKNLAAILILLICVTGSRNSSSRTHRENHPVVASLYHCTTLEFAGDTHALPAVCLSVRPLALQPVRDERHRRPAGGRLPPLTYIAS